MRSLWLAIPAIVAAALVVQGCGDDGPDVSDPVSGARSVAEAICSHQDRCCAPSQQEHASFEGCVEAWVEDLERGVKNGEANGQPYDPACALAAIALFEKLGCAGDDLSFELTCEVGLCGGVLNRGNPIGASCANYACAAGLRCNDMGVCEEACAIAEGSACGVDGQPFGVCAPGLYCSPSTNLCEGIPAVGESCAADGLCASTARCDGATCDALLDDGATCSNGEECTSGYCQTTCRQPPGPGEPCPLGVCGADLFCTTGTCEAPLALGEACTVGVCEEQLECFMGTCVLGPGVGEACAFDGPQCQDDMSCNGEMCEYSNSPWCAI